MVYMNNVQVYEYIHRGIIITDNPKSEVFRLGKQVFLDAC